MSLVPAAIVAIVLFIVGVELFARRDLGLTSRVPWPGIPAALIGLRGPTSRSLGERLPLAVSWGIGIGLMGFIFGAASLSLTDAVANLSPDTQAIYRNLFPNLELNGAGAFLQLAFITFGLILVGFAAATLVNGWATDETGGRLETLLSTPMSRVRWALSSGLGVYLAIVADDRGDRARDRDRRGAGRVRRRDAGDGHGRARPVRARAGRDRPRGRRRRQHRRSPPRSSRRS